MSRGIARRRCSRITRSSKRSSSTRDLTISSAPAGKCRLQRRCAGPNWRIAWTLRSACNSQAPCLSSLPRSEPFIEPLPTRGGRMTAEFLPEIHIVRHGETAWTQSRQHTGLTDIPLTERGEHQARNFGKHLPAAMYRHIFISPLQRARRTCELAGFASREQIDPDLVEWNYGEYDGLTTAQIRKKRPDWQIFRDGCPGGESVEQIGARADR